MCITSPPDKGDLGGFFIPSPLIRGFTGFLYSKSPDKGDLGGFFDEEARPHYRLGLRRAGTRL